MLARAVLVLAALGTLAAPASAVAPPPRKDLAVVLAVPVHLAERRVQVGGPEPVYVVLTNVSGRPLRLWRDWCSWGYFNLRFEVEVGGKVFPLVKKPRGWDKNYPDFLFLPAGELVVLAAVLDPDVWALPGVRGRMRMRAVYQVPPDRDAADRDVWTGTVASPWLMVHVRGQ